MIVYTEKGAGLHDAVRAAGHWLEQSDGEWVSSNDAAVQAIINGYTVDAAKAVRKAESTAHAKTLRDRVVSTVSAGEMASWPIKRAEAMAYSQSGNAADAPMLTAEANARGVTLPAIIARVAANATMFAGLESAISGADGRHRDAIDALASFEAVAAYDLTAGWPAV